MRSIILEHQRNNNNNNNNNNAREKKRTKPASSRIKEKRIESSFALISHKRNQLLSLMLHLFVPFAGTAMKMGTQFVYLEIQNVLMSFMKNARAAFLNGFFGFAK